jgi:hypothetical protein
MSEQCSGISVTPLVLSDTFNTWFQRTNEIIAALDSIELLGIEVKAEQDDSRRGLKIEDGNFSSCFREISLVPGPFVGFVTGSSESSFGEGTTSDPLRLTIDFPTGNDFTLADADLTADDYFMVRDTSDDNIPVKRISTEGVKTKVFGGNKIVVTPTGPNGYTINWVDLTFSPVFEVSIDNFNWLNGSTSRRIGIKSFEDDTLYFRVRTGSGDVYPVSATVTKSGVNASGTYPPTFSFTNGTGLANVPFAETPSNTNNFGYGSGKSRSTTFSASITSADETSSNIPFQPENTTINFTVNFGWNFGAVVSSSSVLTAQEVLNATPDHLYNVSNDQTTWNSVQLNVASRNTSANDLKVKKIDAGGASPYYMYFVYSDEDNGSGVSKYGWAPKMYNNGAELSGVWTNLGWVQQTSGNVTYHYRVLRFNTPITQDEYAFAIGGDSSILV